MSKYTEKIKLLSLPAITLRGMTAFPLIPMSLELTQPHSVLACEKASANNQDIFIVTQNNPAVEIPTVNDVYHVGVVAKIKQFVSLPDKNARVVIEGISRAEIVNFIYSKEGCSAEIMSKTYVLESNGGIKGEALIREAADGFTELLKYLPKPSDDLIVAIKSIKDPGALADFIAANVLVDTSDRQRVLEEFDPMRRIELVTLLMSKEIEILSMEMSIHKKIRSRIEESQREYYLREQMKVIQNELGEENVENDPELLEYESRIFSASLPEAVEDKLMSELRKLAKMPYASSESTVVRNYLDTCLEIPWSKRTKDRDNIETARKILNRDHDGLEKIKERILEFLAVRQLNPDIKNQILCFVGPPGTGKTSVAESIARAMGRKYVRVSLGGIRDEADIRGHRKTYIGSMPGRIITALTQAGVKNPLILLDEVDKLTHDAHGDPASALLEVLDSEQNKFFRDHFVELPIDLSECVFICTANTLDTVPRPLIDRMEIIETKIYTESEKTAIAKHHLIPKQRKRHGLKATQMKLSDGGLSELIDFYTREAGVRNLNREIGSLCRKAAMEIIDKKASSVKFTEKNISSYLGPRKFKPDEKEKRDEIGIVNGLAYTELGGDMLKIEASVMPGSGKIELTGSLGDVMKESAKAAISYIRAHASLLDVEGDFYKTSDIHIHVPEGAVPKDGPSAGVTIATALYSALSSKPARHDVAMTGEITLRGRVMAIGGLKEKTMAAYKGGMKKVLIPEDNLDDLSEADPLVRDNIEFIACRDINDVFINAVIGGGRRG